MRYNKIRLLQKTQKPVFFYFFCPYYHWEDDGMKEKEEKNPIPWELKDPKPPVVQSGHMENRVQHQQK